MNKGFTLIELLAVIIIISLIGLLSIIGVASILNKSKNDLYQEQIKMIEKAARDWGTENIDKLPDKDECIYLTLGNLKTYGLLGENVLDLRSNEKISDSTIIKIEYVKDSKSKYTMEYEVDVEGNEDCVFVYDDYSLVEGESFNKAVKRLSNNGENTVFDTNIKSIVFLKPNQVPAGIDPSVFDINIANLNRVDLSVNHNNYVLGYFYNNTLYVFAEGIMLANAVSDKMFYGLTALESIDFSGIGTENVVSMTSMFESCSSLKYLDLSSFDTSSTVRMDSMFRNCNSLVELNINNFSVNRVTSSEGRYSNMFKGCSNPNITVNPNIKTFITERLTEDNVPVNLTVK